MSDETERPRLHYISLESLREYWEFRERTGWESQNDRIDVQEQIAWLEADR